MAQTYRDPTFDAVAAREARAQRDQAAALRRQLELEQRRESPDYRARRRRKIQRMLRRAMAGRL